MSSFFAKKLDDQSYLVHRTAQFSRSADYTFERIREPVLKLESFPGRGRVVPELNNVGVTEYREVLFKPYRILYFLSGRRVYVHASSTADSVPRIC